MATKKPRVNVVLPEDMYSVLNEYCSLSGLSMSEYFRNSLGVSLPVLKALSLVLKDSKDKNQVALVGYENNLKMADDALTNGFYEALGLVMPPNPQSALAVEDGRNDPLTLNKGVRLGEKGDNLTDIQRTRLFLASDSGS